jgi:MFS family permease
VHPRWLNRGVGGIGAASFLDDVGKDLTTSLLPSLVTSTLGGSAAALGAIEGVAEGLAGVAKVAGGALADDPSRRRTTAMGGYTATAIFSSLVGVAGAAWQVGVLRSAAWFSRGLRSPSRNALLTDVVDAEFYGRAYGFERAMDNLGAIAGPLLAIGLVSAVGVRHAILLSFVPGILAASAIFVAIRSAPRLQAHERPPFRIRLRPVLRGRLGRLMLAVSCFQFGNAAATLLILRATDLISVRGALLLFALFNAAAAVASLGAGHSVDRRGALGVLTAGTLAFLVAYVGFAFTGGSVGLLAVLFALAGVAIGAVETSQAAAVAALAPVEVLGSAFGALSAIESFGKLAASAAAGALWTLVSPRAAFLYLAGWTLVSTVSLVGVRR